MTGIEARDFVLDQIGERDPKGDSSTMKLSRHLATDLLKLRREDIGSLSEELFVRGIEALTKQRLFGYSVEIDSNSDGHTVTFAA